MGVFIAWSEERSKAFATALRSWLPKVLPGLPRSEVRISLTLPLGAPYMGSLQQALAASEVGIVCLTRENLAKPWVHFEAGAVSASLGGEGNVIPLLLDDIKPEELPGALGHFQTATATKKGDVWEVVRSVRAAVAPGVLVKEARERFLEHWPELQQELIDVRQVRVRAEQLVVYLPSLKRNSFFSELLDHLVRVTTQLRPGLPIHLRQSELVGRVMLDNTKQVLTEVASRYPGAVVIMFPPSPEVFDSIRDLDRQLAVNLVLADIHPTAQQWRMLQTRRFFRKLIVVDNKHGSQLAARKVARGPHRGSTVINALICEGDFHRRGRMFRAELNRAVRKKAPNLRKVVWLDKLTELPFAQATEEACAYVGTVLNRRITDVGLRPTYVFCANDSMALGARSAVAKLCRQEQHAIRIVSFDASDIVRDSIANADPYLWCSVDQQYARYAQAAIDAALAILDGRAIGPRRKTIRPTLLTAS